MSKAEEKAMEKYPLMSEDDKEGLESLKYIGIEFDSVYEFNSVRYFQQCYFIEGYQQAEKDLADAFIEKAAKWLEDNAIEYWGTEAVDNGMMIEDFKKAMKL